MTQGSDHLDLARDTSTAAKGAGVFLIGNFVGAPLTLLTQVLIARLLGVEGFGLYELGLAAIRLFEILGRVGLNVAGMRFVSVSRGDTPGVLKGVILASLGISGMVSLALGALLTGLAPVLSETVFRNPALASPLRWFAIGLPWISLMTVSSSLLLGFQVTKYNVYVREVAQPVAQLVLVMIFFWLGLGLTGAVWAFILSHVVAVSLAATFLIRFCPEITDRTVSPVWKSPDLMSMALPLVVVALLNYSLAWADTLLLGLLSTAASIGVYRAAWRIASAMNVFLDATNSIYGPIVAELNMISEKQRMANLYKATTRWVTYATVPIFVLLIVEAQEIMALFGRDFDGPGTWVLRILAFGSLVNCITGGSGITLIMMGRQDIQLKISIAVATANFGLNLFLIPVWGVIGAAVSASSCLALSNFFKVIAVHRLNAMIPFDGKMAWFIGYSSVAIGLLFIIKPVLPDNHILSVGLVCFITASLSGLFIMKSKRDPGDEIVLKKIVKVFDRKGRYL